MIGGGGDLPQCPNVVPSQAVGDSSSVTLEVPKALQQQPQGILTPVKGSRHGCSRHGCAEEAPSSCDSWVHGHGLAEFLEAEGMLP